MCVSVCLCVHTFKHEYLCNQWVDHNQIYLKHHWGGRKAALGFRQDWIITMVPMATAPIVILGGIL